MILKDEKECYECWICDNEKEGEHWWCQSCWDGRKIKRNYCFECVSDKGSHQHIKINETEK